MWTVQIRKPLLCRTSYIIWNLLCVALEQRTICPRSLWLFHRRRTLSMSTVYIFCPYWVLHCCTAVQFVPISNLSIAVGIMQASRLHAGCTQALHTSNMLLQNVNDPVWCAQEGCDQHQPCGKEFLTLYNVYTYIGVYSLLGCTVHTWMAFLPSSKLNMY